MYISKLVENVKPSDTIRPETLLVGMEVKTMWCQRQGLPRVESVEPIGKKLSVTIEEEDDDGFTPEWKP